MRESLLVGNDEYRRLDQQHHEFESRLSALADKAVLSDDEQVEETTLKKRKLQVKDKMEAIARQARAVHP
ncbi:MAG TPA: YdcH family protein [Vicinamibacteria bacterium]|nr:YdcH family protein [Vicinamibacteria bacterium]